MGIGNACTIHTVTVILAENYWSPLLYVKQEIKLLYIEEPFLPHDHSNILPR